MQDGAKQQFFADRRDDDGAENQHCDRARTTGSEHLQYRIGRRFPARQPQHEQHHDID